MCFLFCLFVPRQSWPRRKHKFTNLEISEDTFETIRFLWKVKAHNNFQFDEVMKACLGSSQGVLLILTDHWWNWSANWILKDSMHSTYFGPLSTVTKGNSLERYQTINKNSFFQFVYSLLKKMHVLVTCYWLTNFRPTKIDFFPTLKSLENFCVDVMSMWIFDGL